jgi:hypothetical protein
MSIISIDVVYVPWKWLIPSTASTAAFFGLLSVISRKNSHHWLGRCVCVDLLRVERVEHHKSPESTAKGAHVT